MFNTAQIIGILGAIVLAIAWIPEILEIIRKKRSDLNRKFAVAVWIATILLLVYSIMIRNWVFIAINIIIGIEISLAVYYEFVVEPKNKKRKKKK